MKLVSHSPHCLNTKSLWRLQTTEICISTKYAEPQYNCDASCSVIAMAGLWQPHFLADTNNSEQFLQTLIKPLTTPGDRYVSLVIILPVIYTVEGAKGP